MKSPSRAKAAQVLVAILMIGVAIAVVAGVSTLSYPTEAAYPDTDRDTARVEQTDAGNPPRVILSADAARRAGVQTVPVQARQMAGKPALEIPYGAVFYDPDGVTWTYVAVQPSTFVRQHITVDSIRGGVAVLSAGPPAGTPVVSVGAAQLYGTEVGVEEE
jgi:uncharacterized phage protein gp47/JayE